ncbi:MAG: sensor histidine kinase [Anaerolineae bacterium]
MPENEQQNLFQVFHRASNVGAIQGTGLGLAIVKEITDVHGGSVQCDSRPGQGTSFVLTIPIKE